eukprot:scaffold23472_cov106-Cylindrotheca_fusiformis.AAC.2
MERPTMDEGNRTQRSEIEEVDPSEIFVYTSDTKATDIPKEQLTHLRIDSSSVREIPASAFENSNALVRVQLSDTLTRIGERAFQRCCNLKCVQFVSSNAYCSLEKSSVNPNLEDGLIVFPESMMLQIDHDAFACCDSLRNVIVSSVSTELACAVFRSCSGLISVELPEGLQVIEHHLFFGCGSLTTVKIPSSVIKIGDCAFSLCGSLTLFDLPCGLLEIGISSFQRCGSIRTLHIPHTVSVIGSYAFSNCSGLTHIKLPVILKSIKSYTFNGCCELEYIEIPSAVSLVGYEAFRGCSSLSHIRIPQSVENDIDICTFSNCSSLISIELPEGIFVGITSDDESTDDDDDSVDRYGDMPSLVNLASPTLREGDDETSGWLYNNSRLGSVVDNDAELGRKLIHRFDVSPLNQLCYYQSYHSSSSLEDAMLQLMKDDPLAATSKVDEFGMTPLHILSLSQTPNMSMLLAVMNAGHRDHMIHGRDSFGSTPMDYLCMNRMPNSAQVIRTVLQTRFDHLLVGMDRCWGSDMVEAVYKALAADLSSRRREIVATYLKLAIYERKDILSLVELYLWKAKIDDEVISAKNAQMVNRESCRINSGSSIVIPHVLPFLDKLDVEDYFARSQ